MDFNAWKRPDFIRAPKSGPHAFTGSDCRGNQRPAFSSNWAGWLLLSLCVSSRGPRSFGLLHRSTSTVACTLVRRCCTCSTFSLAFKLSLRRAPLAFLSSQSSFRRADSAQRFRRDPPSLSGSLEQRFSSCFFATWSPLPSSRSLSSHEILLLDSSIGPQLLIPRRGFSSRASASVLCPPLRETDETLACRLPGLSELSPACV